MTERRRFVLAHRTARANCIEFASVCPEGWTVTFAPPTRSLDQNSAQWPILEAFAAQLMWPVNGEMVWMTSEEWKDVLSAAFKREKVRIAMGLDGGVVMLGQRTSKFPKEVFSEWLDFLNATAAMRGVQLESGQKERVLARQHVLKEPTCKT